VPIIQIDLETNSIEVNQMQTLSVPIGAKTFLPRARFLSLAIGGVFYFGET
jgi:hypothetical protein